MSWFEIGGSSSVYLVESESGKRTLTTADKGCFNGRTLTRRSKQRCFGNTDTEKYWVQTENLFGCGAFYTIKKKKKKKSILLHLNPFEKSSITITHQHIFEMFPLRQRSSLIIKKKGIVQAKDKQLVVYMQSLRATLRQNLRHGRQRRASIEIYTARGIKNKLRLLQEFKQPAIENKCFLAHHICKHAESGNTKD